MQKVKWGIISTAKIGVEKVIPAMIKTENVTISAIADVYSRNLPPPHFHALYADYEELI